MAPVGTTAAQLSRGRWAFAFALVTSLFFTWGFAYGLLDVLNAHFQNIFGITKLQSTLLQFAYFGAYFFFSPVGSIFMDKYGYKKGIHLGLTLYSLGAIFFWPSAKFGKYGGFVGCTFVIGCGLSTLEVAANSYIAVLGSPKYAAARLNFSQGFQGVASFAGPMIASKYFFQGKNATSLDTVQWVYLAVAGLGVVLNILFYFCDLPEISGDALAEEMHEVGIKSDQGPFWKQYRCIFGWVAQTTYVGAQVGVASFAVNFMSEQGIGINQSFASQLFSYCQMTFTLGRFVGVVILNFVDPALMLSVYSLACSAFCLGVAFASGKAGVGCLFALFFFESVCYPIIFTLATKNLGRHTKKGSGLIVMGVAGGAWYPPAQGAIANHNTRRSYVVPFTGFVAMGVYAVGTVIWQTMQGGFRLRTIDEIAERKKTGVLDREATPDSEKKEEAYLERI
ncbi:MFS general substrate transporter [Cristinia sonorae]|uniref:MFS general substrate transporter n=1 Tax=Cristinia sonorae TaxID=1940300 RepID=A0A8K0UJ37_9AGAR|nr:MFS general substrate transporter [Cristinia sonorae]